MSIGKERGLDFGDDGATTTSPRGKREKAFVLLPILHPCNDRRLGYTPRFRPSDGLFSEAKESGCEELLMRRRHVH